MNDSTQITEIRPGGYFASFDLAEIWRYRELLYFLTVRDIKVRYKQTLIGILWVVLQPAVTTAIFTFIFSSFGRFETGGVPYPLFALSGIIIWLFVHTSVSTASTSFVNNTSLVTKVYFPRLIVPIAAAFASVVDLVIGIAMVVIVMMFFGVQPGRSILLAPLAVTFALILAASVGALFAALNVRFRDVKVALPFLLQVWLIASPLFYPADLISERMRPFFAINPLTGILEIFRGAMIGTPIDWMMVGISSLSLAVLFLLSLIVFKAMEERFADVI